MKTIEYRVRPVTRYVVTRYESDDETRSAQVETLGEFDGEGYAIRVRNALEKSDPDAEPLPPNAAPEIYPPMSALDLSVRTKNCLRNDGFETVEQLCSLTIRQVPRIPNLNAKGVNEVTAQLALHGLRLRDE